jgi:hypothetical protein
MKSILQQNVSADLVQSNKKYGVSDSFLFILEYYYIICYDLLVGIDCTQEAEQMIYKALDKNNLPIITVIAVNEANAKIDIENQLNRPGRREALKQWKEAGEKVGIGL